MKLTGRPRALDRPEAVAKWPAVRDEVLAELIEVREAARRLGIGVTAVYGLLAAEMKVRCSETGVLRKRLT